MKTIKIREKEFEIEEKDEVFVELLRELILALRLRNG